MTCDCIDCPIDLEKIQHLDDGDVIVKISVKGIDGYRPDHQTGTLAVRRVVEEFLVAPYRGQDDV